MTGQYSIRNGLSLVVLPGSENTLSSRAVTMGDLFHRAGYATGIFGKRYCSDPQSHPTAHGFDAIVRSTASIRPTQAHW